MRTLTNCGQLEVRSSPIEGFGVFAKTDIASGTVLEEVPIILFPRHTALSKHIFDTLRANGWINQKEVYLENLRENLGFKAPERYYFKWHPPVLLDGDSMYTVLPLGFGPIYNTSNTANNADWRLVKDTFVFRAEKDIKADEEIRTFYGYFLSEDGTIFNCENVFHLAMDLVDGKPKVKLLRFGSIDTFQEQRKNPAALKLNTFITQSTDGLTIKKLSLIQGNGSVVHTIDVPDNVTMSVLYSRLSEMKAHVAPLVKMGISYIDKNTGNVIADEVLWKK